MSPAVKPPLEPARVRFLEGGVPYSEIFEDIYFSPEGGLAETRYVFIDGNGLPARFAGRSRFVVGELGFGTGLNFLATLHEWRETWLSRGFMPMFRRLLLGNHLTGAAAGQLSIAARLLAEPNGERGLTNLFHLAELLQQASREQPTPEALLH